MEGEARAVLDLEGALGGRLLAPWAPVSVPVIAIGSQLVGLNWKPGRSIVTLIAFELDGDAFDEGREAGRL